LQQQETQAMALGPGKYDYLCTQVREQTKARGAVVVVFGGEQGDGFSCQADLEMMLALPLILENIARQIRKDAARPKK